jgi:hypothetical protein
MHLYLLQPKLLQHYPLAPYSPDLALADFFLFQKMKKELDDLSLDKDSLKKTLELVIRTITADEFATAFRRWFERCEKCIQIDSGYFEKS